MATYSETILADSPVGYWKLDETSGTTAADSSTNSNDGTIDGTPTMGANGLVFEPSGKCIDFDGVNDRIHWISPPGTNANDSFSMEFWIQDGLSETLSLMSSRNGISGANSDKGYLIRVTTTGIIKYHHTGQGSVDTSVGAITANTPHYVTITKGVDATEIKIYVDSLLQYEDNNTITPAVAEVGTPVTALCFDNQVYYPVDKMQHVAMYDTILTPLQIRQHYQAGIAQGFHKEVLALNPTAYYPLNESTGDAIDWSGNDNNGTLNGGVTQGATGALAYDDSTAYSFDGVDDHVAFLTPNGLLANDAKTIGLWIKTSATLSSNDDLVNTRVNYGGVNNSIKGYGIDLTTSGEVRYSNIGGTPVTSSAALSASSTHFVAVTTGVNGASINIFVDGVSVGTGSAGTATAETAGGYTSIGNAVAVFFTGELQGAFLLGAALTPAQIRTLYQSGKTLIEDRGYPKVIQNLNPTGYWRLGEASGTTAFDESGNDNDGTINGSPTLATNDGALHQSSLKAMTFDGVDDYIDLGVLSEASANVSLGFWVNSSEANGGDHKYLGDFYKATSRMIFAFNESNSTKIAIHDGSWKQFGDTPNDGSWHLIIFSISGTSCSCYVDAVQSGTTQTITAVDFTSLTDVTLFTRYDATISWFKGDAGETFFMPTALTAQQIKQIYEAGKSRYAAEVISYEPTSYKRLNDASGSIVDYGSGGNAGTVVGGVTYSDSESPLSNEAGHTSLLFNGTTGYINEDGSEITVNADSTIIAWSKGGTTAVESIYSSRDATSNSIYALRDDTDRKAWMMFRDSGSTDHHVDSTTLLSSSEWSMLCSSVDVAANEHKAYFDGAYEALTTGTFATGVSDADKAVIGATYSGGFYGSFYPGRISENAVWDGVVLTASQILDIYEMASYTDGYQSQLFAEAISEGLTIAEAAPLVAIITFIKTIGDSINVGDSASDGIQTYLREISDYLLTSTSSTQTWPGGHRYWRVYVNTNEGSTHTDLDSLVMRETAGIGGNDQLSGTATASSFLSAGYEADKALDGSGSNWSSADVSLPAWWKYDFGLTDWRYLAEVQIQGSVDQVDPLDLELQFSDDDTNWTTSSYHEIGSDWSSTRVIPNTPLYHIDLTPQTVNTLSSLGVNTLSDLVLTELLNTSSAVASQAARSQSIIDSVNVLDDLFVSLTLNLTDGLSLDDQTRYAETYNNILSDYLTATTSVTTQGNLSSLVTELVDVQAVQRLTFFIEAISNLTGTDSSVLVKENQSSISSLLSASTTVKSQLTANGTSILDSLILADQADHFFLALILESLQVSSSVLPSLVAESLALDGVDISTGLADQLVKSVTADDTLAMLSGTSTQSILAGKLSDYITFTFDSPVDDDTEYYGWTYNPENKAVTNYNLNFSELTKYKNDFYLANSAGLYLFDGDQDAGSYIRSKITTAGMTFGKHTEKQVPQVFLGVSGTNHVISVSVDNRDTAYYELKGWSGDGLAGKTLSIGKGLIGNTWQFSITDVDQLDFDLNSLEFYPVFLQRKHR